MQMKITLELTDPQIRELTLIIRNGYGDGSYYEGCPKHNRNSGVLAIQKFQEELRRKGVRIVLIA